MGREGQELPDGTIHSHEGTVINTALWGAAVYGVNFIFRTICGLVSFPIRTYLHFHDGKEIRAEEFRISQQGKN